MAMASFSRPSFRCLATCGAYSFDCLRACEKVKIRSIATPNEIIDMMIRITPMALATHPICSHMCIRSIRPSSGSWKNKKPQVSQKPEPTPERDCYCSVKLTVTVMMTGTGTLLSSVGVNTHCLTASSAAWSSSG